MTLKNVTKAGSDKEVFQKSLENKLKCAGLTRYDYEIPDDISLRSQSRIKVYNQGKKVLVFSGEEKMSRKFGKAFIKQGLEAFELGTTNVLLECVKKHEAEGLQDDSPSKSCFIEDERLPVTEGSGHEFKNFSGQDVETQIVNEMPKYVSAFANCKGGIVYFGVDDNRRVHGFKPNQDFEEFQARVLGKLKSKMCFIQRKEDRYRQIDIVKGEHFECLSMEVVQSVKDERTADAEKSTKGAKQGKKSVHEQFKKTDKSVYLLKVPPLCGGIVFTRAPTCPLYDPTEKRSKDASIEQWCELLDQVVAGN